MNIAAKMKGQCTVDFCPYVACFVKEGLCYRHKYGKAPGGHGINQLKPVVLPKPSYLGKMSAKNVIEAIRRAGYEVRIEA